MLSPLWLTAIVMGPPTLPPPPPITSTLLRHCLLHEIFRTSYFCEFRDLKKKSRNLGNRKNNCHEHDMKRKLNDTLGKNQVNNDGVNFE